MITFYKFNFYFQNMHSMIYLHLFPKDESSYPQTLSSRHLPWNPSISFNFTLPLTLTHQVRTQEIELLRKRAFPVPIHPAPPPSDFHRRATPCVMVSKWHWKHISFHRRLHEHHPWFNSRTSNWDGTAKVHLSSTRFPCRNSSRSLISSRFTWWNDWLTTGCWMMLMLAAVR